MNGDCPGAATTFVPKPNTPFIMRQLLLCFALILAIAPASAQKARTVPMNAAAWDLGDVKAEFTTHLGQEAMTIDDRGGDATSRKLISVNDLNFGNGTIEYDIAFRENTGFTAVHFRRKDPKNSEHFYLRAIWADHPQINTAIQYAAVLKGVNLWDLSEGYQSNAQLNKEGWNHVKLVIRDQQMLAYVNDMQTPALYVSQMDGDWKNGTLAFDGSCHLANLVVTPDLTPGLSPGVGFDPTHNDPRYLRNWQVTNPQDFPSGREPIADDVPGKDASWTELQAGHHGLINLSRPFGATPRGERRIAWLKTTITATEAMVRKLDFGFSDEVYVYLNGKPLFSGKNLYNTPGMLAPRGRASLENETLTLGLQEGENEIMIGLTNFFFGWGIKARLDDTEGLRYGSE